MKHSGTGRDHSVSQTYNSKLCLINRARNVSTDSVRSHRPVFNKLKPVFCDEEAQDSSNTKFSKSLYNAKESKVGRNSVKFNCKYNSTTESTSVASVSQKWNESFKNYKREKLGYIIDCASSIANTPTMYSQRVSQTHSMKENMESNVSHHRLVNRGSHPVRISIKNYESFLTPKNNDKERNSINSSSQLSPVKTMKSNMYKSYNENPFVVNQQKNDEINSKSEFARKTFSHKISLNPLMITPSTISTNANELMEFIELEDLCRRNTVTMNSSSFKLSNGTPQNKRHPKKDCSESNKKKEIFKLKSTTQKGRTNDTSHLVKKMSITICKDNRIIYS